MMRTRKLIFITTFLCCFCFLSGFAQDKDKPRSGEGINAFLIRNQRRPPEDYKEKFIELNKGKFGKNHSLLLHHTYILPPLNTAGNNKTVSGSSTSGKKTLNAKYKEPLFGKGYEEYTIKSHDLLGACFYVVSGHGGPDPGAIAKVDGRELHEDEYAYDIALRLARNLLENGATVHIIIQDKKDGIRDGKYLKNSKTETCMGSTIPLNQKKRLKQRSDKINQLSKNAKEKYQRAIFIHLDSRSRKKQLDVFFYHSTGDKVSTKLAKNMRNTFESQYKKHQPDRGFSGTVSAGNLYVLNNTKPTSVFVELANMQNAADQKRYVLEDNRQALANWMLRGFIKDYEDSKKK